MTKLLLTGATGFIGRQVLKLLQVSNWEVIALSGSRSDNGYVQADLLNPESLRNLMEQVRPEYLLHLAWNVDDGYMESPNNLEWLIGSLELLKSFVRYGGKRAVFAGTCAEYDWSYGYLSETTPLKPESLYGVAKNSLYNMASAYAQKTGILFSWGRVFFLYGEGEKEKRFIPSVIRSFLRQETPSVLNPHLLRDYMHVQDAASALVELLKSDLVGPINIASGKAVYLSQLVEYIANIAGEQVPLWDDILPSRKDYPLVVGDVNRLTEELAFKPTISLREGLSMTIDWIASNTPSNLCQHIIK